METIGTNPQTGQSGKWITYYHPHTGTYEQSFIAAKKKGFSPLFIILPVLAAIAGAGVALVQFYIL